MSLELFAFVDKLPDRTGWQSAIDKTGIALKLDPTLDVGRDSGFSPCELRGSPSGFELEIDGAAEILDQYPTLKAHVGTRAHVVCFRWGGDLAECACVLGAALALVQAFGAVAFDPDLEVLDAVALEKEFGECLAAL